MLKNCYFIYQYTDGIKEKWNASTIISHGILSPHSWVSGYGGLEQAPSPKALKKKILIYLMAPDER